MLNPHQTSISPNKQRNQAGQGTAPVGLRETAHLVGAYHPDRVAMLDCCEGSSVRASKRKLIPKAEHMSACRLTGPLKTTNGLIQPGVHCYMVEVTTHTRWGQHGNSSARKGAMMRGSQKAIQHRGFPGDHSAQY